MTNRDQALALLIEEASNRQLHFPTNTQVALKIRQTLDDPDCHLESASKLIQADPLLSAQVVAMANSVAYNPSGREISDVKTAASRLGFQSLRTLVMALVTRQMAGTTLSPEQKKISAQLWEHTAHVASLSRVIAKRISGQNPDTALFIGLIHEIGGFYLLSRASQYPSLLEPKKLIDDPEHDESMNREAVENTLGIAILRQLAVPEPVIEAVEHYAQGYLSMPPATLGDTLLLADYLAPVLSPLLPTESSGEASSIDFVFGDVTLKELLEESAEEVSSLTAALRT